MRSHVRGEHGARGLEARVAIAHLEVLVEDVHELTEMRGAPVASGSFALFDDRIERGLC